MLIIKPRMPRVLGTKRRVGQFGARSLQRSMIHVRRMLISRLPESLSADLQQAAEQPLGWDELPALAESSQGPIVEAPRRARSQASQPVQRSTEASSNTMPRTLQAIFDGHKRMGRVQSNPDLKTQADVFNKSGGAILPESEAPAQPVQRAADEKSAPASDAPPRRRQVRSKVEYVNRPDPDMVRRSRETSKPQSELEDTPVDEAPLDEAYDFVNTFPPDDFPDDPADTQQSIQRAVDRAEAPPQHDIDVPVDSYDSDAEIHTDADSYDESSRDVDAPSPLRRAVDAEKYTERDNDSYAEEPHDLADPAATQQSIQRAVDHAETPSRHEIDSPTDSYSERYGDYDTDDYSESQQDFDDPAATQQSIQRATDRAETHGEHLSDDMDYGQPVQRDADETLQRAIDAAESPPESYPTMLDYQSDTQPSSTHDTARTTPVQRDVDDDVYTQTFIEPAQRRMTITDPQPPTQIQRTTLPEDLSVEQDAFDSVDFDGDYAESDDFIYDNYDAAQSPQATIQPARDDIQRYEEQDLDLGEALFGGEQDVQRRPVPEHDGPTPTLMPPIGKLHHTRPVSEQSMPHQVARRTDHEEDQEVSPLDLMRMASASVDADIARDEAIRAAEHPSSVQMSRDDEASGPDDDEARLLTLLDLPADTPIQREGPPMPTPAPSTAQREPDEGEARVEAAAPAEGESGKSLDEQAQEVYDILKRKLRIENERYKGKK